MKNRILEQIYIRNSDWNSVYSLENRLTNIITNIYHGHILFRYELYDLLLVKIQFKILLNIYECMISKRKNDYGFSIYNIDNPHKFSDISLNKTIKNDKLYLYNIYKIIFRVLEN